MSGAESSPAKVSRARPRRRRFAWLRWLALALPLGIALLFVPAIFQFVLRDVIVFEAWRHSASIHIGDIRGSLFEPITIANVQWMRRGPDGSVTRLEIARAEAEFAWRWRELASGSGKRWFRRLTLDGVTGKVQLPLIDNAASDRAAEAELATNRNLLHAAWLPAPEQLEARVVNFVIQTNGDYVRLEDGECDFSQFAPGKIRARQIVVKQPWLARTFRGVSGSTKVQDATALIVNLTLEPGFEVRSLSADLGELASGRLNAEIQINAFGGEIRGQISTLRGQPGAGIDASVRFSQINIAPLATFLNLSDAAGGTIKEGYLTFRGEPRKPDRATASLRVQANNFQWESRQWDTLVLGATLMDRRIEIPELELHQGHNHLSLNGALTLPKPGEEWWQSDFEAKDFSAQIGNLTELSALMLPEFKYTAGRMSIDGHVRGHDQQFHGAVIVSGSGITWHDAPIEDLRAALRLNGNELQIANLDLLNKDDYVRGRGVMNILGPKQFWGELRASIKDLATYSAILQKPIVPEPLAGGAEIDWTGEGSAKGQSGKFFARLNKLRTLGSTGAMLHPVNALLEGDYAPASVQFSRFSVSDDESSLTANVTVGNKTLSLASLRLVHGRETWLEGDALLPLDIWQSWPKASLETLLSDQTPGKVSLTAKHLQLREAAQLTGWKWPIEGVIDGNLAGEGKLGDLTTSGHVTLHGGRLPLGWSGDALTGVEAEFGFSGQALTVEKFQATAPERGVLATEGKVDFTNIRNPALDLKVRSERYTLTLFPGLRYQAEPVAIGNVSQPRSILDGIETTAGLDLQITGPASEATVRGKAALTSVFCGSMPDFTAFWLGDGAKALPPAFAWQHQPWRNWHLSIDCVTLESLPIWESTGKIEAALKLEGTGAAPFFLGNVRFTHFAILTSVSPMIIEEGNVTFREGFPDDPSLDLRADGRLVDCDIIAQAAGPLSHCLRFLECDPPLTPDKLRAWLAAPREAVLAAGIRGPWLRQDPSALVGNVPVFDWAIPTQSSSGEAPASPSVPSPNSTTPDTLQ